MRRSGLAVGALLLGICCAVPDGSDPDSARVRLALTLPAADPSEVAGLGLYAVDRSRVTFTCEEYLSGAIDPLSASASALVAAEYFSVSGAEEHAAFTLDGIPPGDRAILAECYDGGGRRIFLGCGEAQVSAGATRDLQIQLVDDPLTGSP